MHDIYELKDMLMKELEEYGRKGELHDVGTLEIVDKLAHAIKNICKIIESVEEENGEYSSGWDRSYDRDGRGGMDYSRARGRGRNAKRDAMGRYSSETGRRYPGMSYADGMEEMINSIRGMMSELPQDIQRDAHRFVQKLEEHV